MKFFAMSPQITMESLAPTKSLGLGALALESPPHATRATESPVTQARTLESPGLAARTLLAALLALVTALPTTVQAQDMGADDGGGGGGNEDMSEVLDPTMLGMGGERGANGQLMGPAGQGGQGSVLNLKMQTLLALQELGVVLGVGFMVAGIFLVIVFTEKFIVVVSAGYHRRFGKAPEEDVEDPAALVGTFKRYKN